MPASEICLWQRTLRIHGRSSFCRYDELYLIAVDRTRFYYFSDFLLNNELLKEVTEVRQEYTEGNVKFGSVADFMAELDD
ncbi:MAG: hypothetical protein HC786_14590 [Richelia sp. CSU_2_1]|nr:hypothetical protein [Microcoleus sp. SU_5_6]NJL68496.1 hypothetical protein [Microcoleus sp. SM1_3_4]NJR23290.1 hypothetical protein [Richelia sp. CSU_2_1]